VYTVALEGDSVVRSGKHAANVDGDDGPQLSQYAKIQLVLQIDNLKLLSI
jgi:hypothetical protein